MNCSMESYRERERERERLESLWPMRDSYNDIKLIEGHNSTSIKKRYRTFFCTKLLILENCAKKYSSPKDAKNSTESLKN